jgi:hypothetical protein
MAIKKLVILPAIKLVKAAGRGCQAKLSGKSYLSLAYTYKAARQGSWTRLPEKAACNGENRFFLKPHIALLFAVAVNILIN